MTFLNTGGKVVGSWRTSNQAYCGCGSEGRDRGSGCCGVEIENGEPWLHILPALSDRCQLKRDIEQIEQLHIDDFLSDIYVLRYHQSSYSTVVFSDIQLRLHKQQH